LYVVNEFRYSLDHDHEQQQAAAGQAAAAAADTTPGTLGTQSAQQFSRWEA